MSPKHDGSRDGEVNDQPVTSTRVATNGADALAGWRPNRRRVNGNIDPAIVRNVMTPMRLHKIVSARIAVCAP